jgi:hypothetical protein
VPAVPAMRAMLVVSAMLAVRMRMRPHRRKHGLMLMPTPMRMPMIVPMVAVIVPVVAVVAVVVVVVVVVMRVVVVVVRMVVPVAAM